jgi:hypothetical protein
MVAAEFTGDRSADEAADARYDMATTSAVKTLREHHKQPAPESDVKDEVAAMLKTVDMGYSGAPDRQLFKEFFESVAYTDLSFSKLLEARASPAEAVASAAAIPLLGAGLFVLSSALVNKAYPLKDPAAVARSRFEVALTPSLDSKTLYNLDPNLNPNPVITLSHRLIPSGEHSAPPPIFMERLPAGSSVKAVLRSEAKLIAVITVAATSILTMHNLLTENYARDTGQPPAPNDLAKKKRMNGAWDAPDWRRHLSRSAHTPKKEAHDLLTRHQMVSWFNGNPGKLVQDLINLGELPLSGDGGKGPDLGRFGSPTDPIDERAATVVINEFLTGVHPAYAGYPIMWPGATKDDAYTSLRTAYQAGFLPIFGALFFQGLVLPRFAVAYGARYGFALTALTFAMYETFFLPHGDTRIATVEKGGTMEEFMYSAAKGLALSSLYGATRSLFMVALADATLALDAIHDEFLARDDVLREKSEHWSAFSKLAATYRFLQLVSMTDGNRKRATVDHDPYLENLSEKIMAAYASSAIMTRSGKQEARMSPADLHDLLVALDWAFEAHTDPMHELGIRRRYEFLGASRMSKDHQGILNYTADAIACHYLFKLQYKRSRGLDTEGLKVLLKGWAARHSTSVSRLDVFGVKNEGSALKLLKAVEKDLLRWSSAPSMELFSLWANVSRDSEASQQRTARTWMEFQGTGHNHRIIPFPLQTVGLIDRVGGAREYNKAHLAVPMIQRNPDYAEWAKVQDHRQMVTSVAEYGTTPRRVGHLMRKSLTAERETKRKGKQPVTWAGPDGVPVSLEDATVRLHRASKKRSALKTAAILHPNRYFTPGCLTKAANAQPTPPPAALPVGVQTTAVKPPPDAVAKK